MNDALYPEVNRKQFTHVMEISNKIFIAKCDGNTQINQMLLR